MPEFAGVIAQGWYGLLFAGVVLIVAGLSNAGVMRTPVNAARPGSAWGAVFCVVPFVLLISAVALTRALSQEYGASFSWIMYATIGMSLMITAFGIYLIFASRPPRLFVPSWPRGEADDRTEHQ